jgi:glutamate decarboxylase
VLAPANLLTTSQLIERLVNDLMELTEALVKKDSPMHALDVLGSAQSTKHESTHGRVNNDHGSNKPSGTYAKPC